MDFNFSVQKKCLLSITFDQYSARQKSVFDLACFRHVYTKKQPGTYVGTQPGIARQLQVHPEQGVPTPNPSREAPPEHPGRLFIEMQEYAHAS